ncbi:MAG TPA: hypothetical protein VLG50_02530 [Candidatus Saccharimonadales bacterium]|nr:hypothetical protein [Candidatus Saccharimonadales bacterium]
MSLPRWVKPFFIMLSISESAKSSTPLPVECKDLNLIKGNPVTSTTVLFGEDHFDQQCHSTYLQCAKALSKDFKRDEIVALIERGPQGKYLLCDEDVNKNWQSVTDTCKGWNVPEKEFMKKAAEPLKMQANSNVLKLLTNKIKSILALPVQKQNAALLDFLKKEIIRHEKLIEADIATHQRLFKRLKRSDIKIENFHSDALMSKEEHSIMLKQLKEIYGELEKGTPLKKVLAKLYETDDTFKYDAEKMLTEPNKYLFSSILNANKTKVYAAVGEDHLKKNLYKNLDKFADKNPYAVLTCKPGRRSHGDL